MKRGGYWNILTNFKLNQSLLQCLCFFLANIGGQFHLLRSHRNAGATQLIEFNACTLDGLLENKLTFLYLLNK